MGNFFELKSFEQTLEESCPALTQWEKGLISFDRKDRNKVIFREDMGGGMGMPGGGGPGPDMGATGPAPPAGDMDGGDMGGAEGPGDDGDTSGDISTDLQSLKDLLDKGDLEGAKKAVADLIQKTSGGQDASGGPDAGGPTPDSAGSGPAGASPPPGGMQQQMGPNEALRYLRKVLAEYAKCKR